MNLSKQVQIQVVQAPLTAGTTTNSLGSNTVDMQGFEGCLFISLTGATSTAVTLTAQGGATTTAAGFANYTTSITVGPTTVANLAAVLDVYRPTTRYVRSVLNSTGGNVSGGTIAIKYGAHRMPVTSSTADVIGSSFGVST